MVAMNVTAIDPTAHYLTVWPAGEAQPDSSNLNFYAGTTIPNLVVVKLPSSGKLSVFNSTGSTGIIIDVAGYISSPSSG
ncbi:unannotated protein [freshwater metagenome]|uniref:Unannotated protein n=1 Tax=freshwater metagenome TaxID=449393 RepID=A0A6J7G7U3_9ZZZZ